MGHGGNLGYVIINNTKLLIGGDTSGGGDGGAIMLPVKKGDIVNMISPTDYANISYGLAIPGFDARAIFFPNR